MVDVWPRPASIRARAADAGRARYTINCIDLYCVSLSKPYLPICLICVSGLMMMMMMMIVWGLSVDTASSLCSLASECPNTGRRIVYDRAVH